MNVRAMEALMTLHTAMRGHKGENLRDLIDHPQVNAEQMLVEIRVAMECLGVRWCEAVEAADDYFERHISRAPRKIFAGRTMDDLAGGSSVCQQIRYDGGEIIGGSSR